jgi:hypothetical protein
MRQLSVYFLMSLVGSFDILCLYSNYYSCEIKAFSDWAKIYLTGLRHTSIGMSTQCVVRTQD